MNWEARAALLWGDDTSADTAEVYHRLLMSRSNADRLLMACEMFTSARRMVWAGLTAGGDHSDMRARMFMRTYGQDFAPEERDRIVDAIRDWEKAHPNRQWDESPG